MGNYGEDNENNQHNKPFNDAIDHLTKNEGLPNQKASMDQLPKGIRVIGYFFLCFIVVIIIFTIIGASLN